DVGAAHQLRVVGRHLDAVLPVELLQALRAHVGREDRVGRHELGREEPLDERLAHVAGAQEADGASLDRHPPPRGGRGPKMAVPTRTTVAPSSIATSKSLLMPIDSSVRPCCSPSLRSARNQTRESSGSFPSGGIAMSPRTLTPGSAATASSSAPRPSGATPLFDASPPTFTSTSALMTRLRARARLSSSRARSSRSSDWTT